jgi:hypothetical protein
MEKDYHLCQSLLAISLTPDLSYFCSTCNIFVRKERIAIANSDFSSFRKKRLLLWHSNPVKKEQYWSFLS